MTLQYLDPGTNLGPAGAYHRGVQALLGRADDADLIALLDDNDPPVRPDQVERLLGTFQKERTIDARVAGVALSGGKLSPWTGRVLGSSGSAGVEEVDHLHGWALPIYSAEALAEVGGNDPSFFFGFEELELGRRLTRKGWRLLADNQLMTELHAEYPRRSAAPSTSRRINEGEPAWSRFHKERNLVRVLVREHRWPGMMVTLLVRHLAKPLLAIPTQPRAAVHRLVLGARATLAGIAGKGGIDRRYPPP